MPLAVTHILAAVIVVELFREYFIRNNRYFPRYYILVAAIGGILPDFDFALFFILFKTGFTLEQIHRTFFHTIFIPLILLLVGLLILYIGFKSSEVRKRHMKTSTIFFILAIGSLIHLILDSIFMGVITPFYPFSSYAIGLELINRFPLEIRTLIAPTLDGILILFWLFWMEFKLKITDYF